MKTKLLITLVAMILFGQFLSCETEDWILNVDCNECFGNKPNYAKLIVHLTINEENDSVPLTFYKGSAGNFVDWQDTATTEEFYLDSEIGTVYTVEAQYRSGTETIIAYDSDKMTVVDYGADCGDPCYIVRGGIFEVGISD